MRYVLALAALLMLCAHSWYEPACCSGHDCFPIDSGTVRVVANGYMVNVNGTEVFVSHAETRPSGDEKFHLCLVPTEGGLRVRCFYAPPMGV